MSAAAASIAMRLSTRGSIPAHSPPCTCRAVASSCAGGTDDARLSAASLPSRMRRSVIVWLRPANPTQCVPLELPPGSVDGIGPRRRRVRAPAIHPISPIMLLSCLLAVAAVRTRVAPFPQSAHTLPNLFPLRRRHPLHVWHTSSSAFGVHSFDAHAAQPLAMCLLCLPGALSSDSRS